MESPLKLKMRDYIVKSPTKQTSKYIVTLPDSKNTKLVPCIIHELLEKDEQPSSFTWHLLVQIVKSISSSILEEYYSSLQIDQIHSLPWTGSKFSPELQWILDDFALVGSFDHCLSKIKKITQQPIDGFYLSNVPKHSSWEFLEEAVRLVKKD